MPLEDQPDLFSDPSDTAGHPEATQPMDVADAVRQMSEAADRRPVTDISRRISEAASDQGHGPVSSRDEIAAVPDSESDDSESRSRHPTGNTTTATGTEPVPASERIRLISVDEEPAETNAATPDVKLDDPEIDKDWRDNLAKRQQEADQAASQQSESPSPPKLEGDDEIVAPMSATDAIATTRRLLKPDQSEVPPQEVNTENPAQSDQ